jgi:hypothetical protein
MDMTSAPNALADVLPGLWVARTLVAAFLGVLFLQSGLDKVINWRSEKAYLTTHFAKSPLARGVGLMLPVVTVIELTAGILSALGVVQLLLGGRPTLAYGGSIAAGIGLTCLFLGQRVSKDYAGAAVLVPYFLLAVTGILLFGLPISAFPSVP